MYKAASEPSRPLRAPLRRLFGSWDSHAAFRRRLAERQDSDRLFQGSHGERLDDGACRLRLHPDLLAESKPGARLGGRLHAGLDAAEARDGEDATTLHLLGAQGRDAVDELRDLLGLQGVLTSEPM